MAEPRGPAPCHGPVSCDGPVPCDGPGSRDGPVTRARSIPRVCLISDAGRVGLDSFLKAAQLAESAGLRFLQVREPDAAPEFIDAILRELRIVAPRLELTINYRPEASDAAARIECLERHELRGIHLGRARIEHIESSRSLVGDRWIGFSAHSVTEARSALRAGADYVFLSPIQEPNSKSTNTPPLGAQALKEVGSDLGPVFALGGIDVDTARESADAGAYGVAVIGAILDSSDPVTATRELISTVDR